MIAAVSAALLASMTAFGEDEPYASQSAAEEALALNAGVKTGWRSHFIRRGGETIVIDRTQSYNHAGNVVASSSTVTTSSRSGTVAAVPIGDFIPCREFTYRSSGAVATGRVVSVEIQISGGATAPSELVMQRAVENLVKTGVPLPASAGAKPGRLLSLAESAKRRYGAKIVKPRYDAAGGKVDLFLFNCLDGNADETFRPATPQGLSKEGRIKLATSLKPDTDKGGTKVFSSERTVVPSGGKVIRTDW